MKRRIFIAINLPEDIKRKLADYQNKWPDLPIRWTKPKNIHITLVFLGYVNDEELVEICKVAKEVAGRHLPFSIILDRICYGPPKKIPPRMIWIEGEKSKELATIKNDIEKSLINSKGVDFSSENRAFSLHITLGRIRQWEWRRIEPEERPEIKEEINLSFPVNSIEIMESELKRGGAEYIILQSDQLSRF